MQVLKVTCQLFGKIWDKSLSRCQQCAVKSNFSLPQSLENKYYWIRVPSIFGSAFTLSEILKGLQADHEGPSQRYSTDPGLHHLYACSCLWLREGFWKQALAVSTAGAAPEQLRL